jgi:hypothetical protein
VVLEIVEVVILEVTLITTCKLVVPLFQLYLALLLKQLVVSVSAAVAVAAPEVFFLRLPLAALHLPLSSHLLRLTAMELILLHLLLLLYNVRLS